MRIALIDDEKQVLAGMRYMFGKYLPQHEIVIVQEDPIRALAELENTPVDLLFTDVKMPGMSGTELIARVHALYPDMHIVVLSAYSDFEFVRTCMKNGAFDYLLKPTSYESILDVTNRIEPLIAQTHARRYTQEHASTILRALKGECAYPSGAARVLMMVFHADDAQAFPLVASVIAEQIPPNDPAPIVSLDGYFAVITDAVADENHVNVLLRTCVQRFHDRSGFALTASHATCANAPDAIAATFALCLQMLDFFAFNRLSSIAAPDAYARYRECDCFATVRTYLSGRRFVKLLTRRDMTGLEQSLSRAVDPAQRQGRLFDPEAARVDLFEELLVIHHEYQALLKSVPDIERTRAELLRQIRGQPTIDDLLMWAYTYILSLGQTLTGLDYPVYIYDAIEYIRSGYMRDLTLHDVAQSAYLTPWYFSAQFKRYTGLSFTEYLTKVRIDAAKVLLKQNDLKIYEIATMVGFQEPTYFYTVFKKIEGVSPRQYRSH